MSFFLDTVYSNFDLAKYLEIRKIIPRRLLKHLQKKTKNNLKVIVYSHLN